MAAMISIEHIEEFTRQTLGCNCPTDAFDEITTTDFMIGLLSCQRILISDRLLLLVLKAPGDFALLPDYARLVRYGMEERDCNNLIRCRIVLIGDSDTRIAEEIKSSFALIASGDSNLHLHWVSEFQLSFESA